MHSKPQDSFGKSMAANGQVRGQINWVSVRQHPADQEGDTIH